MLRILALAFFALTLSAPGSPVLAESGAGLFLIIVNPNNQTTAVDQHFIEDAFLKKTTRWPNDEVIRPVDLAADSHTRERFSLDLLKRSVAAIKGYWQQRIFSGRDVPPPELDTDDQVVSYVLKHEGAIGYVSGGAHLNGSKILTIE
jgi:ABC-type phosphate transport system substrate-binding protein